MYQKVLYEHGDGNPVLSIGLLCGVFPVQRGAVFLTLWLYVFEAVETLVMKSIRVILLQSMWYSLKQHKDISL